MFKERRYRVVLYTINVLYLVFALISAGVSIWFFTVVYGVVSLRDPNHYRLDFRVYWPQLAPWLFVIIAIAIATTFVIGCYAIRVENCTLIHIHAYLLLSVCVLQVIVCTLVFVYMNIAGYVFITDTIYDAFEFLRSTEIANQEYHAVGPNNYVIDGFARIEREFQCCGADGVHDYKTFRDNPPHSCCGKTVVINEYTRNVMCEFTSYQPSDRMGCKEVVSFYVLVVNYFTAGVSLIMVLVEIAGVVIAFVYVKLCREERKGKSHYIQAKTQEPPPLETDF